MKIRQSLLYLMFLMLPGTCFSQVLNDKTLLTVEGKPVPAGEFMRMYRKSAEPGKKQDVADYLEQYIIFRLKVADAISEGIDTTRAFRNELNGYRNQLAQSYLTDPQAREKLLQKTYQRSLTDVNAWHILISCPEGAKAEDTLIAWQKATDIKERIVNGEVFEQVARATSDDPSARMNGGNLGYFTVFQMIMPFEDAAYILKKGAISDPVRTPYGYHVIKVTDKRASKGKILVAHIMKASPPGSDENQSKLAEEAINNIFKELQAGVPFADLAIRYSDHKESASMGGRLNWFGTGEIISEFAEVAFSIADTGKYTSPVRTTYGWHIIKLLDKKAPGSYDEVRSYLESKLNQSYLNSLSKKSFINKLKKDYRYRINQSAWEWFVANTDSLIIRGMAKYDRTTLPSGNLYSFADLHLTTREFASYIEKRGPMIVTDDPAFFINESVETLLSDQIMKYENSVLEKKYPEFRYLINEFHDGILLFEISGRRVWNKIQEDTAGLKQYYETHKKDYLTLRAIDAKIYTLRISNGDRALTSAYNKYAKKRGTDLLMQKKFSKKNDSVLVITEGKWFSGDDRILDGIDWIKGPHSVRINGYPSIVVIRDILEPEPLAFGDVQAEMITGYQEYLENEWIKQLKGKYTVKTDEAVLTVVRKELGND